jgi:hypothetical protein
MGPARTGAFNAAAAVKRAARNFIVKLILLVVFFELMVSNSLQLGSNS